MQQGIKEVFFERDMIFVRLHDGREAGLPLGWFPLLSNATDEQRRNYQLFRDGQHIHWPDLEEDLSLKGFLSDEPFILPKGARMRHAA